MIKHWVSLISNWLKVLIDSRWNDQFVPGRRNMSPIWDIRLYQIYTRGNDLASRLWPSHLSLTRRHGTQILSGADSNHWEISSTRIWSRSFMQPGGWRGYVLSSQLRHRNLSWASLWCTGGAHGQWHYIVSLPLPAWGWGLWLCVGVRLSKCHQCRCGNMRNLCLDTFSCKCAYSLL